MLMHTHFCILDHHTRIMLRESELLSLIKTLGKIGFSKDGRMADAPAVPREERVTKVHKGAKVSQLTRLTRVPRVPRMPKVRQVSKEKAARGKKREDTTVHLLSHLDHLFLRVHDHELRFRRWNERCTLI